MIENETDRLIRWFSENTLVLSVDTAIQAKDRFDLGERARIKDRAAFLLAKKLIDAGMIATTVGRSPQGDVMRLQVQVVRPEVWCPSHEEVFEILETPHETPTITDSDGGQHVTQ